MLHCAFIPSLYILCIEICLKHDNERKGLNRRTFIGMSKVYSVCDLVFFFAICVKMRILEAVSKRLRHLLDTKKSTTRTEAAKNL